MKFERKQKIEDYQEVGRVVMLYGPRRVGKTTMAKAYLASLPATVKSKYDIGDDLELKTFFEKQNRTDILDFVRPYDVIVIDEAQMIRNIGFVAKIIIDEFPNKKIILTGSSSFDLAQQTGEPLVGRQFTMLLLPVSLSELTISNYEKKQNLENLLIYGSYPEIIFLDDNLKKEERLKELITTYLYKDILALDKIKSPELLLNITKALAYQIGDEVSLTKLAKDVGETDHKKISRYIDLLEKTFVIKKLKAFSTNQRNEIKKHSKYFFYDVGIRNAVIYNFNILAKRNSKDIGSLWENFVFMELYKQSNLKKNIFDNFFFWRSGENKEIDLVIEGKNGKLEAYESKYGNEIPSFKNFLENYKQANCFVVNRENFLDYL